MITARAIATDIISAPFTVWRDYVPPPQIVQHPVTHSVLQATRERDGVAAVPLHITNWNCNELTRAWPQSTDNARDDSALHDLHYRLQWDVCQRPVEVVSSLARRAECALLSGWFRLSSALHRGNSPHTRHPEHVIAVRKKSASVLRETTAMFYGECPTSGKNVSRGKERGHMEVRRAANKALRALRCTPVEV